MAPVARELSPLWGVLEPLQTATSLKGQFVELKTVLEDHGDVPLTLVGSSWGAMLSFLLAAECPSFVRKLILVGSPPFEERYATTIMATRLSRLSQGERLEAHALIEALSDPSVGDKDAPFAQLGELFSKADAYDPLTLDSGVLECRYDIHQSVWRDATELRAGGKLLELGRRIQCPVVAIHGDYDPHPPEGVQEPLTPILRDFRFLLLRNCGHHPWIERAARDGFFAILKDESR
jgi:pimeloyl-ACP methyl ester carboxylesterase